MLQRWKICPILPTSSVSFGRRKQSGNDKESLERDLQEKIRKKDLSHIEVMYRGRGRRGLYTLTRNKDIRDMLSSRKCLDYLNSTTTGIGVGRKLHPFSSWKQKSRVRMKTRVYSRTERKMLGSKGLQQVWELVGFWKSEWWNDYWAVKRVYVVIHSEGFFYFLFCFWYVSKDNRFIIIG